MKNVYRFVSWDIPDLEELSSAPVYKLLDKLNRGEKLTREEKSSGIFGELWHSETYQTGRYKLRGYIFDFSPFMKTFRVKLKYYGWKEIKAFDRTSIRKNATFPSYILRIVDLPDAA